MPQKNCTEESYAGRDGLCCKQCEAGTYKEKDCDQTTPETRCKPCERDHFTATRNHMKKCRVCKTCNINNKLKTLRACTAREDTVCECVPGYYCSDSGCDHCRQVTLCPAGHGVTTQALRTNDIACSPCESGTFSDVSDHRSPCRPHTRCEDIGKELKTPGNATTDAVCGNIRTSCPWVLPAGLWGGLVLTSALVFALALFCWRSKRRRLYREVNVRLPEAPVAVAPAATDELKLPLPSKELNGLYQAQTYTPSYSCDLQVYASDGVSGDGPDIGGAGVPITPLKVSVSFLDSPDVNGGSRFCTADYERTISEPQEDEWCGT